MRRNCVNYTCRQRDKCVKAVKIEDLQGRTGVLLNHCTGFVSKEPEMSTSWLSKVLNFNWNFL